MTFKKHLATLLMIILLLSSLLPGFTFADTPASKELRGVWVATVLNLDYPLKQTVDEATLKAEADAIISRTKASGLNAIFLQVRPTADAFYSSAIFPWSNYLTGTQGVAPSGGFDPLKYWVDASHAQGIELHAWINPYRITKKKSREAPRTLESLHASHPARLNPSWVVAHTDGNLYFNPGLPEVRDLIARGVDEIVKNYDVDGIHFDDYFYPGIEFKDEEAFKLYGNGKFLGDWRRDNVNALVKLVYDTVKASKPNVAFGISPFGIWRNASSTPEGSQTKGQESFGAHYADSVKWIKDGIIDYIMPQIYWEIGKEIADYKELVYWWSKQVEGTKVKFYVGHAAYRTGNASSTSPWYGDTQILEQLRLNEQVKNVSGSVFFRDGSIKARPSLQAMIKGYYDLKDTGVVLGKLAVNNPSKNLTTSYDNYYLSGESDPNQPLFVNGVEVTDRSVKGYFGVYMPLALGNNVFTFTQGTNQVTRTITKSSGSSGGSSEPATLSSNQLVTNMLYPQNQQVWQSGETIQLYCQAPIGSTVKVTLGGSTYTMTPDSTQAIYNKIVPTAFRYSLKLPDLPAGIKSLDLGAPVYTMTKGTAIDVQMAPSSISVIGLQSPYFAEVINEEVDTYFYANSKKGSAGILAKGMQDQITALTGDYARLSTGKWIFQSNIAMFYSFDQSSNVVLNHSFNSDNRFEYINFNMTRPAAVNAALFGGQLIVEFTNTQSLPELTLGQSTLVSKVSVKKENGLIYYIFDFKDPNLLNGYYIDKTASGIKLALKKPIKSADANLPLKGISIMIDPGHGGKDTGALGILGATYAEKHINLDTSLKLKAALEKQGATVYMTRTSDLHLSLYSRLRKSYEVKPDLFISMHANSIGPNVNINKVRGFSVHYKQELAQPVAESIRSEIIGDMVRTDRGLNVDNFYVVRGTWAPSILLETGFVPNPIEFEWLSSPEQQTLLANEITQALVRYFK